MENHKIEKTLKGDDFINRYRFTGKLTTKSPLHIGSGEESEDLYSDDERKILQEKINQNQLKKIPAVSTIVRDGSGKPYIPGSTLRGVLRHWLHGVFSVFGEEWAAIREYQDFAESSLDQTAQAARIRQEFSWLEILFGTALQEGKIEFWDAKCTTGEIKGGDHFLHWNPERLTYIDTSVAIDPNTGTALENMLYRTELVPRGVEFTIDIVGQNLNDVEIGIILFALQGINSKIWPVSIGAQGARGYGRMKYEPTQICCLGKDDVRDWAAIVIASYGKDPEPWTGSTGYYNLPTMSEDDQKELINTVTSKLAASWRRPNE